MWPQWAETTAGATHYAETHWDSDRGSWKVSDRDGPAKIKLQGVNDRRVKHLLRQPDVGTSEGAPMHLLRLTVREEAKQGGDDMTLV